MAVNSPLHRCRRTNPLAPPTSYLNLRLGPALLQRSQSPPLSYTLTPILPLRLRANISIFQRMAVEFMTRAYRLADCLLIRAFTRVQSTDGFHYLPFTATSLNAPSLTS